MFLVPTRILVPGREALSLSQGHFQQPVKSQRLDRLRAVPRVFYDGIRRFDERSPVCLRRWVPADSSF